MCYNFTVYFWATSCYFFIEFRLQLGRELYDRKKFNQDDFSKLLEVIFFSTHNDSNDSNLIIINIHTYYYLIIIVIIVIIVITYYYYLIIIVIIFIIIIIIIQNVIGNLDDCLECLEHFSVGSYMDDVNFKVRKTKQLIKYIYFFN